MKGRNYNYMELQCVGGCLWDFKYAVDFSLSFIKNKYTICFTSQEIYWHLEVLTIPLIYSWECLLYTVGYKYQLGTIPRTVKISCGTRNRVLLHESKQNVEAILNALAARCSNNQTCRKLLFETERPAPVPLPYICIWVFKQFNYDKYHFFLYTWETWWSD